MSIPGAASPLFIGAAAEAAAYQIDRSLRFNKDDTASLSRTPSSASNRKTWTWSGWVKRSDLSARENYFFSAGSSSTFFITGFLSTYEFFLNPNGGQSGPTFKSTAVFRDPSAWYHIVIAFDSTQSTSTDRLKVYINGDQITDWTTNTYPSQNDTWLVNNTNTHRISGNPSAGNVHDGYLAEIHFVDGAQLAASDFGEYDSNNVWQPKEYSGTYGTNGFHLDFSDNSSNAALGTDSSGNSNTWTVNNLSVAAGPLSSSRGTNYDDDSATYTEYGTVSQASSLTLPMSNPSHYEGAAMRVNSGGFKVVTTNSATTDFFMACWVKLDNLTNGYQMGVDLQGSYKYFEVRSDGSVLVRHTGGGASQSSTGTLSSNTWMHIALSRSGSTLRAFVDGTIVCSTTAGVTGNSISANEEFNFFGQSGTLYNTTGYLLDPVVYIGAGRSTNYTAPTAPLLTSAGAINDVAGMSSSNRYYASPLISVGAGEEAIDSLIDTPTNYTATSGNNGGNYATFNPLDSHSQWTLSNGNLEITKSTSGGDRGSFLTLGPTSGKFYWEVTFTTLGSGNYVGLAKKGRISVTTDIYSGGTDAYMYSEFGKKHGQGNTTGGDTYGATWAANDVIGCAVDWDAGDITFYKNGTSQGTAWTGQDFSEYMPAVYANTNQSPAAVLNTGARPFAYTPPTGYVSLCTQNLADPTIADGSTAMDVVAYTGDGTSDRKITTNMGPDFVWIKSRSANESSLIQDVVRGSNSGLSSSLTDSESAFGSPPTRGYVKTFESDGFTVDAGSVGAQRVNTNGRTYVAWTWDGGTSTVSNTDGSITSSVRANASAGISIVSWTGRNGTVGHGLNDKPGLIITKIRNQSSVWPVQHSALGTNILQLQSTGASAADSDNRFNATAATSSVFTAGTWWNSDSQGIAYCFAPVEGFSAFGSYTGNGSADGPFIFTGHLPRFVIIKRTDASGNDWQLYDTARSTFNEMDDKLKANTSGAEVVEHPIDFLSNGFKPRNTANGSNGSGASYIYASFASNPFKTARAR